MCDKTTRTKLDSNSFRIKEILNDFPCSMYSARAFVRFSKVCNIPRVWVNSTRHAENLLWGKNFRVGTPDSAWVYTSKNDCCHVHVHVHVRVIS